MSVSIANSKQLKQNKITKHQSPPLHHKMGMRVDGGCFISIGPGDSYMDNLPSSKVLKASLTEVVWVPPVGRSLDWCQKIQPVETEQNHLCLKSHFPGADQYGEDRHNT